MPGLCAMYVFYCIVSQWNTLLQCSFTACTVCIQSSCILTRIKMYIIPEMNALSTALFIFDFTVNKTPFYMTNTANIIPNTSEDVFLHMSSNIHHIEKVSNQIYRPYWFMYYIQYVLYTMCLRWAIFEKIEKHSISCSSQVSFESELNSPNNVIWGIAVRKHRWCSVILQAEEQPESGAHSDPYRETRHEANCSPPSIAEVKNGWGCTSIHTFLHGFGLKEGTNFTFYFCRWKMRGRALYGNITSEYNVTDSPYVLTCNSMTWDK